MQKINIYHIKSSKKYCKGFFIFKNTDKNIYKTIFIKFIN